MTGGEKNKNHTAIILSFIHQSKNRDRSYHRQQDCKTQLRLKKEVGQSIANIFF